MSTTVLRRWLMQQVSEIEAQSREIADAQLIVANESQRSAIRLVTALIVVGLGIALAAYLASIRSIAAPLRQVAGHLRTIDGDLTARLTVKGEDEISEVGQSFNDLMAKIHNAVTEVSLAVQQIAKSSIEMDELTVANLDRSCRQQVETGQIFTATREMTLTVSNVADSAHEALRSATDANSEAMSGQSVVDETLGAIQELGQQVMLAAATIDSLKHESTTIGSVIDVIGEIADQTNVLALNAAIEAARAGDQGRGFSVVADEVRTLANRTQQSTSEILAMIEGLQSKANGAAQTMHESSEMAQSTVKKGLRAGASLNKIVDSVTSIQGMNQQIASASEEHRQTTKDISESLDRINKDSQEVVADNNQISDTAQALSQLSKQLEGMVSQFQT